MWAVWCITIIVTRCQMVMTSLQIRRLVDPPVAPEMKTKELVEKLTQSVLRSGVPITGIKGHASRHAHDTTFTHTTPYTHRHIHTVHTYTHTHFHVMQGTVRSADCAISISSGSHIPCRRIHLRVHSFTSLDVHSSVAHTHMSVFTRLRCRDTPYDAMHAIWANQAHAHTNTHTRKHTQQIHTPSTHAYTHTHEARR